MSLYNFRQKELDGNGNGERHKGGGNGWRVARSFMVAHTNQIRTF